jgi:hypothetical protein
VLRNEECLFHEVIGTQITAGLHPEASLYGISTSNQLGQLDGACHVMIIGRYRGNGLLEQKFAD